MKRKVLMIGLGILMMGLCLMTPHFAATQADDCVVINFEELADVALIGDSYESQGVRFETFDEGNGVAWAALSARLHRDSFCGAFSGDRVANLSLGQPVCNTPADQAPGATIYFAQPVRSVKFQYIACNEVSVEVYNRLGAPIVSVLGGKTNNGPPHCNWRSLGMEFDKSTISRITIRGVAMIDDLEICGRSRW
jgi:hypothetical protein